MDGAAANNESGTSVSGTGDVNGDGRDDVIVGAPYADPASRSDAGSAYIVYGFGTASLSYPAEVAGTQGVAINPLSPAISRTGTASFAVSPALPAGLALDATTGVISGTPQAAGTSAHQVTMTDLSGQAVAQVQVQVAPAPVQAAPASTPPPSAGERAVSTRDQALAACAARTGTARTRCAATANATYARTIANENANRARAKALAACDARTGTARANCRTRAQATHARSVGIARAAYTRTVALAACTAQKGAARAACQGKARTAYSQAVATATRAYTVATRRA